MRAQRRLLLLLATQLACGSPPESSSRVLLLAKGSDSMVVAALAWSDAYRKVQPEVGIAVTGGGTGIGVAALIDGTADLAHASRRLSESETAQLQERGALPLAQIVGYDAPTFVVHADNPLESLSFAQLAELYGEGGTLDRWSDLGVEVSGCPSDEIVRASRQDSSGTYAYLRRRILGSDREYRLGARHLQGSQELVTLVASTPCAIGYTGMAYAPPAGVRTPCLRVEEGGACVVPSMQSAVDGTYPLARPLLIYSRDDSPPEVQEYLRWVLSDAGQCLLRGAGYAPIRPVVCPPPNGSATADG